MTPEDDAIEDWILDSIDDRSGFIPRLLAIALFVVGIALLVM